MSERRKDSDLARDEQKPHRNRAVAYYRHSAGCAEDSMALQQEQVRQFAREEGVEIIKEFADCGKPSGSEDQSDALDDLMENWVKSRDDFQYVLCMDATRWGRCQETTTQYNIECKRHGKEVIYTSIDWPNGAYRSSYGQMPEQT